MTIAVWYYGACSVILLSVQFSKCALVKVYVLGKCTVGSQQEHTQLGILMYIQDTGFVGKGQDCFVCLKTISTVL